MIERHSRATSRDSSVLAIGSLISGLAAYVFIAVGTRSIGSEGFAAVSVLWTLWAMNAAVFTFPVQHWVIRTVEADQGEGRVRAAFLTFVVASVVIGIGLGFGSCLLRADLFGSDGWLFPLLAGLVPLGSTLSGVNRGILASRRRFGGTAAAIAGENLVRMALAFLAASAGAFGLSLIGGFAVVLLWPSSFRIGRTGIRKAQISPLAFVGGVAGGSLVGQLVLTVGPVLLALTGGSPAEVTGLFSALALFRAPYMIAIGVSPRLTASLTRLALEEGEMALRLMAVRTLVVAVLGASAAAVFGAGAGVPLLRLVFGSDLIISTDAVAVVAAASALALCSLFLTLVMVAAARVAIVSVAWLVAGGVGAAYVALGPGSPLNTVTIAFLVAEAVAVVAIGVALFSPRLRSRRRL